MSIVPARILSRIPRGAILLAVISIANLIIGLLREVTVAYFFGTSPELDAFLVALTLPKLLAVNIAEISVAVVLPIYVGYRDSGRSETATLLLQRWFALAGVATACICVLLFFGSELVIRLTAPGFAGPQQSEAAQWLRLMLPYAWLLGMPGVFKVVLNSNGRFALPAMSNPMVSLFVIGFCAGAARTFGADALAIGFLAGSAVAFSWQFIGSRRFEPQIPSLVSFRMDLKLPIYAGAAMVLRSVALQVDTIADRAFASGLPAGSIAAYNYAHMINAVPSAVVTSVFATALFPVLSRMVANGDCQEALRTARRWSKALVLLGLVPVIALVLFRDDVVSVLLKRGAFEQHGVSMTAEVLSVLPFLILVASVSTIFSQLLLAQRRARVLAIVAVLAVAVKIGLSFVLVAGYGLVGLAIAALVTGVLATAIRVLLAQDYRSIGALIGPDGRDWN